MPLVPLPFLNKSCIVQCVWTFTASCWERSAEQTFADTHMSWTFKIKVALVVGGSLCVKGVGEFVETLCEFKKCFCCLTCILHLLLN